MSGNHEYNGWEPLINYGRRDDQGNLGLWEWAGSSPEGGLIWSGVLLGYRPPELSPEDFFEAQQNQAKLTDKED